MQFLEFASSRNAKTSNASSTNCDISIFPVASFSEVAFLLCDK